MPRQPSREKTTRHRLRQALQEFSPTAEWAGVTPLPTCPECGRTVISDRAAPLCSRCWKRSPAAREWNRERVARQRSKTPSPGDQE
jgi:hypothetical protein